MSDDYESLDKDTLVKRLRGSDFTIENKNAEIELLRRQQDALVFLVNTFFDQLTGARRKFDCAVEEWTKDHQEFMRTKATNEWLIKGIPPEQGSGSDQQDKT